MKHPKFFLSTLFAAAALSVAPAVPALADGDGTQSNPYTGSVGGLTDMFDAEKFPAGSTVYIDGITAGYFGSANTAYTCVADINIGSSGMTLTNGYSEASYTFTGKITGTGDWKFSASSVSQDYIFLGDMSGYSGNIDYSGERHDNVNYPSYFYFGNGGTAATDTNVSGTGSITHNETVIFNYSGYATQGSTAITIGNSSITAEYLTFTGSVNYNISSALKGTGGSSSSLTISTSGTVTLSGDVSDFASVTVSSGSTLAFDGSVSIGSAITNEGTVSLNESVIFVLDDMSFEGDWSTGATYTLVSGGTIKIDSTTLTSGGTISFNMDNLYVALGTIDSFTFNYDGTSLTVTVTGEEIVEGINGDGSAENPYFTYGTATNVNIFTGEGTTVYIATDTRSFGDANSNTYWSDGGTAACNIVIGKAGIYLTNGGSSQVHNFTGSISGEGSWTVTSGSVAQHYGFTGDLSGWSGDFTISTSNAYDYAVFGGTIDGANSNGTITGITGAKAATNESVSGTGAISVDYGVVEYVYATGAGGTTGETLAVTNTSIEAHQIIFDGGVNYNVSSDLKGWDNTSGTSSSDSTLQISTSGTVTVTGSISNFDNIVVSSGSTLALSGTVDLSSAIQNSGTVALNDSVVFALDNMDYTGELSTGAVYTLIEGGTIQIGNTTLTGDETISLGVGNLYTYNIEISSATFSYENGSLIVTVIGEAYTDGLHGDGTANSPYFTTGSNAYKFSFDVGNFTAAGTTVYLATDTHSFGSTAVDFYWSSSFTAACDIVIGAAGICMTDGGSGQYYNFTGKISGDGGLTTTNVAGSSTGGSVAQHYGFTGDLSGWNGDITITTSNAYDYLIFGGTITGANSNTGEINGISATQAATNTSVSGTGAISVDYGSVEYVYTAGANGNTGETLTVTNSSIEAHQIIFTGGVNYDVSSDLKGWDNTSGTSSSGSTLEISTTGKVTLSGTVSGFDIVTVASGSTLAIAESGSLDISGATVNVSSAISNSGTVIVDTSTIFVLDSLTGGDTTEGTTYTIISGGTIIGWDDLDSSNFITDSRVSVTVGTGDAAGTITLVAGVAADLIWSGSVDNVWDRTTKNWLNDGTQDKFAEHDNVTFTTTGQGTVKVESEGVIANIVTVASGTYSFTGGDITVTDSFVISSGAEVDLGSGNSTIYGDVVVGGTLKLAGAGGSSGEIHGTITIDDGGLVELDVGDATGYAAGNGVTGITINKGGTLYVGTNAADGANQTLGGCTLTLVGGTITGIEYSNIDLYTGSSVVTRATSDATAEDPTVSTITGVMITPRESDYGGTVTFDIGDNAVLKVESGIWAGSQNVYNNDIEKTGAGTLEVTGIFALNEGKLDIQEGSVVLEGTVIGVQNWGYYLGFASAVTISAGASLEMNLSEDTVLGYYTDVGDSDSFVGSCSITGSGDFTKSGDTSLTVSNYGVTGSTTVSAGTLILSGDSTIGGTVTIASTLQVASGASLTIESTLGGSDSTGTITFADGAKLIISDSFLGSGIEITVNDDGSTSVSTGGAITIVEASTITFGSTTLDGSTDLSSIVGSFVQYNDDYTLTWAYSDGALTATITDVDVNTYLLPTTPDNSNTPSASNGVMAAGYYVIDPRDSNTLKQGWIAPVGTEGASSSNVSFEEGSFFYGEGLLGITAKQGSGDTVETFDLTNVDASNLKGQLIVINEWNNEADVKILGDSWANVEFLFGGVADDETLAEKYGLTGVARGAQDSDFSGKGLYDYLALQGDTTFAGVTGATKGATIYDTNYNPTVLNDHEFLTVASNGTTLTIAGSDEYAFYGTVGTTSNRVTISMTGSGTQTFGGTNYLQHVFVSDGNLIIAGNTDVASTTTVSGGKLTVGCSYDDEGQSVSFNSSVTVQTDGTLEIAGTVYFSEVVSNSGTVTIDSGSATFVVDNLTKVTVGDTSYYEIISNSGSGSIDVSGGSLSISNFSGEGLSGRWAVYNGSEGLYIYMTTSEAITWAGTEDVHTWTNDENVLDWLEGSEEVSFFTDAEVRFTDSAEYKTVSVVDAVRASSVTVTAEGYIFEFEDNGALSTTDLTINSGASLTVSNASITATNLTVSSGALLELAGDAGTLTATTATIAGSISLGSGTTLDLSSIDYSDLEDVGLLNITGTGTLVVAGVDAVGTGFTLDDEFTGTLSIASGGIDVCASSTNATAFELAGGTSLVVQTSDWEITQDVSFVGDSGTVTIKPSEATGIVISGDVTGTSGVTIQKNGSGDITFTGAVNVAGTYHAYQGTTTFAGDTTVGTLNAGNQTSTSFTGTSATIGTLNFNNAGYTVEFSGGGTYTVGAMNISQNSTLSGTVTITDMTRSGGTLLTITEGSDVTVTGTFVSSGSNAKGNTTALEKDAKLTVETMTNAWGANFTLAEGSVFSVSNATFSSGTTACSISGSGTFIVGTLAVSNYANYTFDGITLIADTITLGSNTDALTFTGGGNFTVKTMTDTATNVNVNIGEDTTLNVTGSMGFGTGSAMGTVTKVTGAGADTSTLVVGELDIGTNNGVSVQMTDLTLVVGSFVNGSNSSGSGLNFYLYLQDSTLGFTNDVTIATHSGGSTSRIVLGTKSSDSFSPTEDFSTVTINTSKYDTETGTFSATEGVTVTISETIIGGGALIVDGVGTLILSGTNSFEGGVTLAGGTLAIGSTSALGTGTLTICEGTVLTSTSGTITLTGQSFVIDGSSTFSGIVLDGEMTFDWAAGAVISMTDSASVTGTGTVTFADDTDFTYDGVILFTNTGLEAGELEDWTASYSGEGYESFSGTFSVDSNGNIIFVANDDYLDVYGSLVWNADSSKDQTWVGSVFQGTEISSDDRNYLFNEKSTGATSLLSGEIKTNRVTIAAGAEEITWTTTEAGTSISGTDLNIEVGATLNFTPGTGISDFALNFSNINLSGALVYAGAAVTWDTVTFGYNTASLTLSTTDAVTISNLVAETDGTISSTSTGTLTIANLSGSSDVNMGGSLSVELGDVSNYSGTINVGGDGSDSVTLTLAGSSNTYEFADVTIVVGTGGTLDANGQADIGFNTVLAGGTLTSSSSIGNNNIQFPTITLTADSSVDAGSGVSFGMVARGYAESDLYLNGNTLTKTGEGTFFLLDTTISGAGEEEGSTGTIKIDAGTLELDGVIVKDTAIVVGDSGKLYIAAANGYSSTTLDNLTSSGTVEIGGGATLELVSDTTLTGALVIDSNGTLSITSGAEVDLTGVTSSQAGGSGALIISDGATVKISNYAHGWGGRTTNFGSDMYNGLLQISDGGVLEVTAALDSSDEKSGKRGFSITSGTGTYRYSGEGTSYIVADGNRNIHLADGATLVFDVVETDSVLDVSMLIANGMSSTGDVGDSATTSTGSIEKTGAGKLILSGSNLYSGGTKISAGTLEATNASALGTGAVEIAEDASLTLNADGTFNLAGVSGAGSLTISAGTLATSSFTLSGDTTISTGATLALSATSDVATSSDITVEEGAYLTIDTGSYSTSFSGTVSGSGTLSKSGSGTLTLTDNVTVTNIAMSAGTLSGLALSDGMTATITGGTLDGFSMTGGELIISESGSTSITGNVTLSGGSISMTEALDSTTPYFTVASDVTVTISGSVTFSLENLVLSGTDASVVIFDSGVTLDGIDVDGLTLNYGGSGGDPHFNPDEMGFVYDETSGSLSATLGLQSVELYWEGSSDEGGNILAAEGAQNLHDAAGTSTFFLAGDTIYFDGDKVAVTEVTLGSDIDAAAIIVQNGAEITLDSDNGTYALTGEGTLSVAEDSSLTLKNANHSYTGDTTVDGSLTLGITEASGSGQLFASLVSGSGSLTLDIAEDLTISIADNLTGADNQLISGSLTFIKSGDGTLVVDAAQTGFSGEVQITGGTMVIAETGLFGDNATIAIDEGGTLEISADIDSLTETLTGAGTLLVDEDITLVTEATNIAGLSGTTVLSDGAILELNADSDATLSGAITGSAETTLIKTGDGTLTLASGTTVTEILVTAGTLGNVALSDGMTLATTQGTTLSSVSMTGGTLTAAKGTTISGIEMSGGTLDASNVFDDPTDSLILSGSNSFSGGTVLLGEGTLLEDGVQSDPIVAAFVIDSDTTSVSGDIVFSIDNVELPDAVFDDEGKRIYTISYQVFDTTDGTLEGWTDLIYSNFAIDGVVLSGSERARVEIADDGSVKFYITDYDLTWNGGESGVWNTSDVVWTRDEGYYTESYDNGDSVTFTNEFGKLNITLGGDVNPMTLTVAEGADVTINGGEYKITGSKTKIVIEEDGKLTLTSGGNDFGGGVTINDGGELALKVSSNEAYLNGVEISLASGASGTFTIDTDANVTYETILSDTTLPDSADLTLVKDGSGTLTITSELGYENLDLEVKEGTLAIATDGSVGSVDIKLSGSASLELENTDTENSKTISNSISGVGSATTIVKTGDGEIIIDGDNSGFSGSVEIYEGTLTLSSADALGSVTKTTIAEDGTLKLDIESDFDLNDIVGTISGSGTIEIDLGENGTIYASSGYYGSGKFTDFTGSFVIDGDAGTTITMEVDVSSTSRGSAIGDANVELGDGVNLVFNIQSAGYSYGGEISGSGTVSFNWDSTSAASHTFSLTGDNSNFSGTIDIPEDIVLTAKGGAALGSENATVDNSGELWIDEDATSTVVAKLTGSGSLHKTGSGAVKITNADNDLTGSLEIRAGSLCFKNTDALGGITTASVSEGAVLEVEVDGSDNEFNVTVTGEGSVVIHGEEGSCIVPYTIGADGYSTDQITLASNDSSSYNGGFTINSAYLVTEKNLGFDDMNELGTSTVTITNNSTWDASDGGFTASGSRTINIQDHSRLLAGAFKAESGYYGSISISNIRVDTDSDDAADLYISVTSSNDISRNYITGTGDGKIYMTGVDIYLDTTITSFGQITVIDTSEGLEIVGTPNIYINGELEAESYWINGVISQDSISEDVKKNGLSYAAMVVMPTEAFNQDVRTIHSRLEQRRFAFSREGEWEFFAQAQTIQEDSGSSSDSKSFDYYTYGAIVGADVRIDQTTIFGMALAYDHGDAKIHDSGGHIKMDDYRFTAFGSKVFANWLFVEGGVQAGVGSYDIRRRAGSTVGDNNGDTDGVNVGGFFNFGGVVPITNNIFLTPYIGFTYMYSHVDSFDEEGSYGYKADDFDANSLRGKIGTQVRAELMLGDVPTALALGLSYAHEFIDDDIDYDVAAINYSDKKQSLTENAFTEDLISIGLSAEFGLTDAASVFMGYNADIGLGNSEVSHAVNAGVKVTF